MPAQQPMAVDAETTTTTTTAAAASSSSSSSSSATASSSLFREQISHWEALAREHSALRLAHDAALASQADAKRSLQLRDEQHARDEALIGALRQTAQQYVDALAMQAANADARLGPSERAEAVRLAEEAAARELKLKSELSAAEATLEGMSSQLGELGALRERVVALEGERDALAARARLADHRAKEQEALVLEYAKRANAAREAMGRAAMDHQRKQGEGQAQLNTLAEKLRQEKGLVKQLQRRNQELSFSAAAAGGGGAGGAGGGGGGGGGGGVGSGFVPAASLAPKGLHEGMGPPPPSAMFRAQPPPPSSLFGSSSAW